MISSQASEIDANYLAFIHILDTPSIRRPFQENYWYRLIKDRKDKNIVQILNDIYKTEIESLQFTEFPPPLRRMIAALPHYSVGVDWLGDGCRYAMNILAVGVLIKGTALLIEELETHQHPESLRKLIQTLFELAREQDLQLFLTTHSMELITYALDAAEERGIDLKLHHLTLDQEGTLTSIPMSQPNARVLLDIGHDPRLHYKYVDVE
jgi:AAA15 family ATPase/GTPase